MGARHDPTSCSTNAAVIGCPQPERSIGQKKSRSESAGSAQKSHRPASARAESVEVERLVAEVDRARHALLAAREEEEATGADVEGLAQASAAAAAAVDPTRADRERLRECLAQTEAEVAAIQGELARLAAGGRATAVEAATASAEETTVCTGRGSATAEEELGSLGRKELDEIRSFSKPPLPVRQSLELVQALFAICPGSGAPPAGPPAPNVDRSGKKPREEGGRPATASAKHCEPTEQDGSAWSDVQAMLQRHDFIPRLLQLRPHDLAADPPLLYSLTTQWPALSRPPLPPGQREAPVAKASRRGSTGRERALGRDRARGGGRDVAVGRSSSALAVPVARGLAGSAATLNPAASFASRTATASAVATASPLPRHPLRRAATDMSPSSLQQAGTPQSASRRVASQRSLPGHAGADGDGSERGVTNKEAVENRMSERRVGGRSEGERDQGARGAGGPLEGGRELAERGQVGRAAGASGSQTLASPLNRMEAARVAAAGAAAVEAEASMSVLAGGQAISAPGTAEMPVAARIAGFCADASPGLASSAGASVNVDGALGLAPTGVLDVLAGGQGDALPWAVGLGLTLEAVEFASQPCGTLFRWCGAIIRSALALQREREELACRLATQSKRLHGLLSEAAAVASFSASLEREYAEITRQREAAEARQVAARAARVRTELALGDTVKQLAAAREEAARAAAAAAAAAAAEARDAAAREERRVARAAARKEAQRRTAAAVERALAQQREAARAAVTDQAAWIHTEELPPVRPIEFSPHGVDLGPESKPAMLVLARAVLARPELRLHIAGHSADDEEPRFSSARAQAVGAALIAAGVPPNRLRAKGYGPTVPLTPLQRARLRLRSERRVTVHAIAAVRTVVPFAFDPLSAELGPQLGQVVEAVAALLREQPQLRLSVEGHADPTESRRTPPEVEDEVLIAAQPAEPSAARGGASRGGSTVVGDTNSKRGGRVRAASAARGIPARDAGGGAVGPSGGRPSRGGDRAQAHALASQRSMAVHDALVAVGGVAASRLVHHAFGDSLPVADPQHEEGRAANRRVQLLVIPDVSAAGRVGLDC